MPTEKLTLRQIAKLTRPGRYSDGRGLYLQVTRQGAKSWIFRYERAGVERYKGLGPLYLVDLRSARAAALEARAQLARGIDPIAGCAPQESKTFDECMLAYLARHHARWASDKHRKQWKSTLRTYVSPSLGDLDVRLIDTAHVLHVLEPIWTNKTDTASRLRERIERVLAWAAISGYRAPENPARWRGHLQELLPPPSRLKKIRRHPSMPYPELASFIQHLRTKPGCAARALEMTILSACRSSEVRQAQWTEFDLQRAAWTIPAERMKSRRVHHVPLTGPMLDILGHQRGLDPTWVFPGAMPDKPINESSMLATLKRLGYTETVHGFRASFRTWAAEQTRYPKEVAELALAHAVGSAVERAYQRSDLFDLRRALMRDWAKLCNEKPSVITKNADDI